jgi:MOSC domain-containing protein YiiM
VAVIRRFLIHDSNSANGKLMEVSIDKKKRDTRKGRARTTLELDELVCGHHHGHNCQQLSLLSHPLALYTFDGGSLVVLLSQR